MSEAIFLDREGTITRNAPNGNQPPGNGLIHGAASAIASLRGLGYKIIVVTNDPAIADGAFAEQDIVAGHAHLNHVIRRTRGATVDRFYYCPYEPAGRVKKYRKNHPWRKPNPGMLIAAKEDLQIDLSRSWVVGSGSIDVKAGVAAGARTILLDDKSSKHPVPHGTSSSNRFGADFIAPNLKEAVKVITQQRISESTDAPHTLTQPQQESLPNTNTPLTSTHINPNQPYPDQEPNQNPVGNRHPIAATEKTVQLPSSKHSESTKDNEHSHAIISPAARTLRQILQELRRQRSQPKEFSYPLAVALVLQLIAVVFALGAFIVAGTTDDQTFTRWMSGGTFAQLAVIAMLLFHRRL